MRTLQRLMAIARPYAGRLLLVSVLTSVGALAELLERSREAREQIRRRTRANLEELRAVFTGSVINVLNVEGGWTAVLQVPRIRTEQDWAVMLLGERDVLVQPGFFYDFEAEAYLVVSLLTAPAIFAEGIRRII